MGAEKFNAVLAPGEIEVAPPPPLFFQTCCRRRRRHRADGAVVLINACGKSEFHGWFNF
jgi:hypothetical protein